MSLINKVGIDIDWSLLESLSDGDEAFQVELLRLYLSDTRKHLPKLQIAIAQQNADALRVEAHYLKGASSNIGGRSLSHWADQLESCGRSGELESAQAYLASFCTALAQLEAQIDLS
jgi:HPt (histidine-containing phosphotransfer) domain-containing protein